MITAISPAMTGIKSNYNVNFGQLRPQNQVLKNYDNQQRPLSPSFGDTRAQKLIGNLIVGVVVLILGIPIALLGHAAFLKSYYFSQAQNICEKQPQSPDLAKACAGLKSDKSFKQIGKVLEAAKK